MLKFLQSFRKMKNSQSCHYLHVNEIERTVFEIKYLIKNITAIKKNRSEKRILRPK